MTHHARGSAPADQPDANAISLTRVWAAYAQSDALQDVSLHVTQGEFVALVGPNNWLWDSWRPCEARSPCWANRSSKPVPWWAMCPRTFISTATFLSPPEKWHAWGAWAAGVCSSRTPTKTMRSPTTHCVAWACYTCVIAPSVRFRAGSANAFISHALWPLSRDSCCWTNRWPASTRKREAPSRVYYGPPAEAPTAIRQSYHCPAEAAADALGVPESQLPDEAQP